MPHFDHDRLLKRTKAQILDEVEGQVTDLVRGHNDSMRDQSQTFFRSMGVDPAISPAVKVIEVLQFENTELKRQVETLREENRQLRGEVTSATFTTEVLG